MLVTGPRQVGKSTTLTRMAGESRRYVTLDDMDARRMARHDPALFLDVGISDDTAKRWLRMMEKSGVVFFLRPYANNLLKRTVKTPKLYFFDTGLVAYLTRHSAPDILANGAVICTRFEVSALDRDTAIVPVWTI